MTHVVIDLSDPDLSEAIYLAMMRDPTGDAVLAVLRERGQETTVERADDYDPIRDGECCDEDCSIPTSDHKRDDCTPWTTAEAGKDTA
jgi:hypothetical protein